MLLMADTPHRSISSSRGFPTKSTALLTVLLLMHTFQPAASQPLSTRPTATGDDQYDFSSTLTILIVAIISVFLLMAFFSIYLCWCARHNSAVAPAMLAETGVGQSRRGFQLGLDSYLLEKIPMMLYSSVKMQKLGKESLECAVCLCEFEDDDTLRFLPRCNHVYHRDCIDIWFAAHVTCPICRTNLAAEDQDKQPEVAISVEVANGEDADRHPDLEDLVRIGSHRREARLGSVKSVPLSLPSKTDWVAVVAGAVGERGERFRLQLPEDIKQEIIMAAGRLSRSASHAGFAWRGEESSRWWYREGVGRGWQSLRFGGSGRWRILGRSFSARAPAVEAAGSVSGPENGEAVTPVIVSNDGGSSVLNLV